MSIEMKSTFIFSCLLFITGILLGNDSVIGTSVVIFVVLGCTLEIIETIEGNKDD